MSKSVKRNLKASASPRAVSLGAAAAPKPVQAVPGGADMSKVQINTARNIGPDLAGALNSDQQLQLHCAALYTSKEGVTVAPLNFMFDLRRISRDAPALFDIDACPEPNSKAPDGWSPGKDNSNYDRWVNKVQATQGGTRNENHSWFRDQFDRSDLGRSIATQVEECSDAMKVIAAGKELPSDKFKKPDGQYMTHQEIESMRDKINRRAATCADNLRTAVEVHRQLEAFDNDDDLSDKYSFTILTEVVDGKVVPTSSRLPINVAYLGVSPDGKTPAWVYKKPISIGTFLGYSVTRCKAALSVPGTTLDVALVKSSQQPSDGPTVKPVTLKSSATVEQVLQAFGIISGWLETKSNVSALMAYLSKRDNKGADFEHGPEITSIVEMHDELHPVVEAYRNWYNKGVLSDVAAANQQNASN